MLNDKANEKGRHDDRNIKIATSLRDTGCGYFCLQRCFYIHDLK